MYYRINKTEIQTASIHILCKYIKHKLQKCQNQNNGIHETRTHMVNNIISNEEKYETKRIKINYFQL